METARKPIKVAVVTSKHLPFFPIDTDYFLKVLITHPSDLQIYDNI